MKRIFYLNSDFDIRFSGKGLERYRSLAAEFSVFGSLLGRDGDFFLSDAAPPDEYYQYLCAQDISFASPASAASYFGFHAIAWGMNSDARKRFGGLGVKVDFPDESIVKTVNSRIFSSGISQSFGWPSSLVFNDVESFFMNVNKMAFPAVLKSEFGSSGSGFAWLRRVPDERTRVKLGNKFSGCSFVAEPWRNRVADFSASFFISKTGDVSGRNIRMLHSSSRGGFDGITLFPQSAPPAGVPFSQIDEAIDMIAGELFAAGYFGPASIDSYLYKDGGELRLNALSEINARMTMAGIALSLLDKTSGAYGFMRLLSAEKSKVALNYLSMQKFLGDDAYSPRRRRGILVLSPLAVFFGAGAAHPRSLMLFAVSDSLKDLNHLRGKIEKVTFENSN